MLHVFVCSPVADGSVAVAVDLLGCGQENNRHGTSHVTRHTSHVTRHASQSQPYRILKVGDGTVEVLNQRVEHLCTGYEMPIVMAMIMMMMMVITILME